MGYWRNHGLRGSYLEDCINQTNQIYLEQGLAVVQKIPTSITPVELDTEHGNIKRAYFDEKSTVDYMGNVQGIPICFDAKETGVMRLPIANIHEHQIAFMNAFHQQDGLSFLVVMFRETNETFLLPFETLIHFWNNAKAGGRKSIPYDAFDKKYLIPSRGNIMIHWLETLNIYLNARNENT